MAKMLGQTTLFLSCCRFPGAFGPPQERLSERKVAEHQFAGASSPRCPPVSELRTEKGKRAGSTGEEAGFAGMAAAGAAGGGSVPRSARRGRPAWRSARPGDALLVLQQRQLAS